MMMLNIVRVIRKITWQKSTQKKNLGQHIFFTEEFFLEIFHSWLAHDDMIPCKKMIEDPAWISFTIFFLVETKPEFFFWWYPFFIWREKTRGENGDND